MKNINASRNNLLPTSNKINVRESKNFINNNSLQSLSSTFTTKLRQSRQPCPLQQVKLDYKKLQELAKEIDESELCYDTLKEPNNQESKQLLPWTINPANYKRCTCYPKKGQSFEEVVHKFRRSETDIFQRKLGNRGTYAPPNSTLGRQRTKAWVKTSLYNNSTFLAKTTNRNNEFQYRNLLKNLDDEYFAICSKHHELATRLKIDSKWVEKPTKLIDIEKSMLKKEQEIETVMSMYKDLVELRAEMGRLKQSKQAPITSANLPKHSLKISKPIKRSI